MAGLALQFVALAAMAWFSLSASTARQSAGNLTTAAQATLNDLWQLQAALVDAETGQRGFLLTGNEEYLHPFLDARVNLPRTVAALEQAYVGLPEQRARLAGLQRIADDRLVLMDETIRLQRAGDPAAIELVRSGRGKALMDEMRAALATMRADDERRLALRRDERTDAVGRSTAVTWLGSLTILVFAIFAAVMMSRDYRARETEVWLRGNLARLRDRLQGEQRLDVLAQRVLEFCAAAMHARVGALYVTDADGTLRRVGGYAVGAAASRDVVKPGEGLLGQAASDRRLLRVRDIPADYFAVSSVTGVTSARELMIAPIFADGVLEGVLELGFLHATRPGEQALLQRAVDALGIGLRSSRDRSRLEALLEETQQQAEELQTQQEELRVSNEELEEQSHALKESQARLETQQAELEQTNLHLSGQATQLEAQRDELERVQAILTARAADLAQANRYKSEFLANMSHELRTPLNSTLILAKLLADNREKNLTDEQVKFAQTITAAGNDLLALINDILDLSRIEAGKVAVNAEDVVIKPTLAELLKPFEAMAAEKRLSLELMIEANAPVQVHTDPHRLSQILRNLLANALKFTERGVIRVRVSAAGDHLAIAVEDSGIGIAPEHQGRIFEAFQQADGSTHRRYGGTGLGLSISRDLARLLGGDLTVRSAAGQGSTFTVTIPRHYQAPAVPAPAPAPAPVFESQPAPSTPVAPEPAAADPPMTASPEATLAARAVDDRNAIGPNSRVILIIEDDERFAGIMLDLARQLGFTCIVTHTAAEGLAAAERFTPHGILLDVNLPDHSGLGVLDRLKRNPATRHIPIHVASVADYTQEALERGAIGYALKPVMREQLVDALRRLEAKFTQTLRRVLVVEDDLRQRDSIRALLSNNGVEIVDVALAADALAALRTSTFDCMVMDLNLPDLSGYDLLEQMAQQDDVAFPPVIVYTGRNLTADEERRLHRYSRSIIIKDARSPERLLDEVTLFLHQVEATLPLERQRMLLAARDRDATFEGRRILVVEDDARNIFALSSVLEPKGAIIDIARNGREALDLLEARLSQPERRIDLVLMDIMMPEMDGLTAMRQIRLRPEWKKLPIIALTAKAMRDDLENSLAAGANDYIAKPLDVERLLSLVRVWMPR